MSVVDSREDLEAAKARLAGLDEDDLAVDLRFWSVACIDAAEEHRELAERQAGVLRRYQEAQEWTQLIAREHRARRDARLPIRPPAED